MPNTEHLLDELAALTSQLDQSKARLLDVTCRDPEAPLRRAAGDAARELDELERWMRSLRRRAGVA